MPAKGYIVHHVADGTGRDTYINFSSGGQMKTFEPIKYPSLGTFYPMRAQRPRATPNPVMVAKHIHYHPDGQGRDRYIE